jgi:hypothetical protein
MFDNFQISCYNMFTQTFATTTNKSEMIDDMADPYPKQAACFKVEFIFYNPTELADRNDAINYASKIFNKNTITLLEGDIHTIDGKVHPFFVTDCKITCIDAVTEDDL